MYIDWDKLEQQEYAFLDTKDIDRFISDGISVGDAMDLIEQAYGGEYLKLYPDDDIFDCIDEYDFAQYIKRRYGITTYEVSETRFQVD